MLIMIIFTNQINAHSIEFQFFAIFVSRIGVSEIQISIWMLNQTTISFRNGVDVFRFPFSQGTIKESFVSLE